MQGKICGGGGMWVWTRGLVWSGRDRVLIVWFYTKVPHYISSNIKTWFCPHETVLLRWT